jgi:hypothetical protein
VGIVDAGDSYTVNSDTVLWECGALIMVISLVGFFGVESIFIIHFEKLLRIERLLHKTRSIAQQHDDMIV